MAIGLSDWMSCVPDEQSLSDVSIPGTHDSATYVIGSPWWKAAQVANPAVIALASYAQCQSLSITEQLTIGIRFLDIRIKPGEGLPLYHGIVPLSLGLGEVLDEVDGFLADHPTETVIVCIKSEDEGDRAGVAADLKAHLDARGSSMYRGSSIPLLGEVRGRAVLLNRVYELADLGIFLYVDDKMTGAKDQRQADGSSLRFYVQDQYDPSPGMFSSQTRAKRDLVTDAYDGGSRDAYAFRMNFLSASSPPFATPARYADDLNERVDGFLREHARGARWITVLDYAGYYGTGRSDPIAAIASANVLAGCAGSDARSELARGDEMSPGDALSSPSRAYEARFQTDGNFVVVRAIDGLPVAATMTNGSGADRAGLDGDGRFTVTRRGKRLASAGGDAAGSRMVMQDDGNLVIYDEEGRARWASQTVGFDHP